MNLDNNTTDLALAEVFEHLPREEVPADRVQMEESDPDENSDSYLLGNEKQRKYALLSREDVEMEVAKAAHDKVVFSNTKDADAIPSFNEFYGFPLPDDLYVHFSEHPEEFGYIWELLNAAPEENLFEDPNFDGPDYIKEHIVLDVDAMHFAESIALVSELPVRGPDEEIPDTIDGTADHYASYEEFRRIQVAADLYASYDELRRLVALSRLLLKKGFDPALLDDFIENASSLFNANRDRILLDKCKKIIQLARLTDLRGEIMTREPIRKELLKN